MSKISNSTAIYIASLVTLLCSCIAFFSGLGLGYGLVSDNQRQLTETGSEKSAPSNPEETTYEPAARPVPQGRLLLEDEFIEEGRWQVLADEDHNKGYEDGHYYILAETAQYNYWSVAGESFADFVLEIETRQIDGPDENDYGVILRYQDDNNFYSFRISGDGYYAFDKIVDGEFYDIIRWQESQVIRQGSSRNTIRVEAIGDTMNFCVNDEFLDTAIDPSFSAGDVGVVVGTYENVGVHIAFDNLRVWAVEQ